MDALLVIFGAVIGAVGSIVGGIIAANRQLEHARRERREIREETALREMAPLLEPVRHGARVTRMSMEANEPREILRPVGKWYFLGVQKFMEGWHARWTFDIHTPVARAAVEAVVDGSYVASYSDPTEFFPEANAVRFMDRAAQHLVEVTDAITASPEELEPSDWRAPTFGDTENEEDLEIPGVWRPTKDRLGESPP